MDRDLADMLDCHRIRAVVERYCRGVDRLDENLINSVYWPDATDDHGIWSGPGRDFAAFIVPVIAQSYVATMHCVMQSNVTLAGSRAAGDTYCMAIHRRENADGTVDCDVACCRYVDVFEKRGEEWRILDRKVVMEHVQGSIGIDAGQINISTFTRGRAGRADPSYRAEASLLAHP